MSYILIVFASVTSATKMKKYLSKKFNIDARVVQTPKSIGKESCSYCLKTEEKHLDLIWKIITENNIATKGIFREKDYEQLK